MKLRPISQVVSRAAKRELRSREAAECRSTGKEAELGPSRRRAHGGLLDDKYEDKDKDIRRSWVHLGLYGGLTAGPEFARRPDQTTL